MTIFLSPATLMDHCCGREVLEEMDRIVRRQAGEDVPGAKDTQLREQSPCRG